MIKTQLMNDLTTTTDIISHKIHTIRGLQVMLDRDLAELYGVKAIRLREQVKRNSERFPDDFMFQLREDEVEIMVSQNAIPSKQHLGGSLPLVFTEQGVATLSSVLTSTEIYHIGASLKDLGKKWFAFSKFEMGALEIFGRLK